MSDSLDLVFLQCLIAAAGLIFLLLHLQTPFLGITCLFALNVSSASLSAFFWGRVFGLKEQWITAEHERVFLYSGWMILAIVAAMWLAWWPFKRGHTSTDATRRIQKESFSWLTPQFIYFALALGTAATIVVPFVLHQIPTVGTAVNLLASWLKVGLILAVVLFRKRGSIAPLAIALALFVPAALVNALRSGFTPFSMDVLVPIVLILAFFNRVTPWSFIKLFLFVIPCMYLMFGWMASRNLIRSGELEQFSMLERGSRFADVFFEELGHITVTPYDIQNLLFERIDMSDILAEETAFQNSPGGEDQFAYGATLVDGAIALVPRAIWEDKPVVAGYAEFVGRYTGAGPRTDSTSIGVPVQFELYANGGAPFVIVGIFILSYLCARLERFIAITRRPLHILMPAIMFLMPFANGIEQIMLVLSTALAGALTVLVVARVTEIAFPQFLPQFRTVKSRRALGSALPTAA